MLKMTFKVKIVLTKDIEEIKKYILYLWKNLRQVTFLSYKPKCKQGYTVTILTYKHLCYTNKVLWPLVWPISKAKRKIVIDWVTDRQTRS